MTMPIDQPGEIGRFVVCLYIWEANSTMAFGKVEKFKPNSRFLMGPYKLSKDGVYTFEENGR